MKRIYPFLAFLFSSYFSFAQYENFDLSKYKLPDIKRHQLDLYFNFSNNYQNSDKKNDVDVTMNNLTENFNLSYKFYENNRKLQRNYYSNISSNIYYQKDTKNGDLVEKDKNFGTYFYSNFDHYFYLKENTLFLHLEPVLDIDHNIQKDRYRRPSDNLFWTDVDKEFSLNPSLNIGVGLGRIESVGDLRHAIYILEEFEKNGLTKGVVSEFDVLTIAEKVTELKNKRFFDSRLRKIYEIKSLDSLFQSMEMIKSSDAVYFTVLNDIWLYGNEQRHSGKRLKLDITSGWDYSESKHGGYIDGHSIEDHTRFQFDYGVELAYEAFKPIGLKWQREFGLLFSVIHRTKPERDETYEWLLDLLTSQNEYNLSINYGYNWYLSTRTSANFGCAANYFLLDYTKNDDTYVIDQERYRFDLYGSLNYYISPRLRLKYRLNLNYGFYDESYNEYKNQFNFSNQVSLNYAIF